MEVENGSCYAASVIAPYCLLEPICNQSKHDERIALVNSFTMSRIQYQAYYQNHSTLSLPTHNILFNTNPFVLRPDVQTDHRILVIGFPVRLFCNAPRFMSVQAERTLNTILDVHHGFETI